MLQASLVQPIGPPPQKSCPEPPSLTCPKCPACPDAKTQPKQQKARNADDEAMIPKSLKKIVTGMARTNRHDFGQKFDLGVPFDKTDGKHDKDVLMIYSKDSAMPKQMQERAGTNSIQEVTVNDATDNCDHMHVLFHHRGGSKNLCLAIVPQYESFHLQNWMRVPPDGVKGGGNRTLPLRMVSRGMQWDGVNNFDVPKFERQTKPTWEKLKVYLETLNDILKELKPIVKNIKVNNTVIVMVCNFGQSQLLMNFACTAKSRNIDTSMVLVFATDEETKELAERIGLTAYYNEQNFGHMPSEAALEYGDFKFVQMMMAKVMCVHLTSLTGVDLLFQDVDVVWYKDPLPFFHDEKSPVYNYDAYFQDDGARSLRYTPYSANSGFYYLRNNHRTQYFLSQLMLAGDLILKTFSHQQALIALLSEHVSLYGLKVKVLSRDEDDFPGGYHYHRVGRDSFFRGLFKGEKDPYIFHMSWTLNKDNKLLFLKQLGEWYVHDKCVDKKLPEISLEEQTLPEACCSKEALFSCHYRDKPSKYPCSDSPPIDKDGKDFWK